MDNLYYVMGAGILAMLYAFWKTTWINNQDEGSERMKQIGAVELPQEAFLAILKSDDD